MKQDKAQEGADMSIYKDCDIRGIYQEEFDQEDAYLIGKAVGSLKGPGPFIVGGDVRLSTPVLKKRLIQGLMETGAHVVDIGTVTTPLFYFAMEILGAEGGIMVTASHNPAQYNGFKLMFGSSAITPSEIKEIEERVKSGVFISGQGKWDRKEVMSEYREYMKGSFPEGGLKIVLDCCDGAASKLVPSVMEYLGYEVVRLYCGSDGRFPNRNPNPADYTCLTDICKKVRETGADLGAAYDGDGDRVVFIDNQGRYLTSEKSFSIFIKDCLSREKGSIVYDQKSSSVVKETILQEGGIPVMERSGYGFIKQHFLNIRALAAGEISGHFFFRELGRDDGLYATLRMCRIIREAGKTLAKMSDELRDTLITPDYRMYCPYEKQEGLLAQARKLGERYRVSELDGVRIEFADGWFLLRRSVTEQAVTFRLEAGDKEAMERIKTIVAEAVPKLREHSFFGG